MILNQKNITLEYKCSVKRDLLDTRLYPVSAVNLKKFFLSGFSFAVVKK